MVGYHVSFHLQIFTFWATCTCLWFFRFCKSTDFATISEKWRQECAVADDVPSRPED